MSRKRGKLSKNEETFILKNVHTLDIQEIADAINRTIEPVAKFIKGQNIKGTKYIDDDSYERNMFLKRLRDRNYYPELKQMLTDGELKRFEEDWVEVTLQFRDDVMYTEEVQIKQWIMLQILADRSMKSRKVSMNEIEVLQNQLEVKMAEPEDDRDIADINNLNQQMAFARESLIAFTREHGQILDKIKDIEKSLKATRDARVKRIEDSKTSWMGYLRMLEEEAKRKDAGDDAEIKKIAKDVARERLAQWHEYEDGGWDQPLLTPETAQDAIDRGIENENENDDE